MRRSLQILAYEGEKKHMSIIVHKPQYQNVPPGVYRGGLEEVEDLGIQDYGFDEPHRMLRLTFVTDFIGRAGEPLTIRTLCTASLHRKSKLHAIATALLRGPLPDSFNDVESLVGLECQLVVSLKTTKSGTFSSIDSFLPPKIPPPSTPPPPAPWHQEVGEDLDLPAVKN
jgi:hypothetical protein